MKPGVKAKDREWLKGRNKMLTGYCGNGQCEGTKPVNHLGEPLPVCHFWEKCPCLCHYRLDELFKMTGQERRYVPNDKYIPKKSTFVMPEPADLDPLGGPVGDDGPVAPVTVQEPVAANVAAPVTPLVERRGPSGRSSPGGLEARVWAACRELSGDITPKAVSEFIADRWSIPLPSAGAIREVFIRWDKLGYATWAKKPIRFTGFKGEGSWEELARIKAQNKRADARTKSALARGFR